MAILVRYFARLREELGRDEERIEVDGVTTVAEVWSRVRGGEPLPATLLVAVNQVYARGESPVKAGDEVAFFPPVTGG